MNPPAVHWTAAAATWAKAAAEIAQTIANAAAEIARTVENARTPDNL